MTANVYDSTVLLTDIPNALRSYRSSDGATGITRDGSFLCLVVEEIIALSATRIAMLDNRLYFPLEMLPKTIRDRIVVLDQGHLSRAIEFRDGLFGPIMHECGTTNEPRDSFEFAVMRHKKSLDEPIALAFASLYQAMSTFLLGMDQKLWIDVEIGALKDWARTLRAYCKDPQSRMNLASIEGLLGTYISLDAPMLRAIPAARPQLIETFQHLLEDESYQELSRAAGRLGIPAKARRALTLMRRCVERVVLKPAFKHVFDVGAKAITLATHVPMPGSGIAESMKSGAFLPPVVALKEALDRALRNWKEQRPEVIVYPVSKNTSEV